MGGFRGLLEHLVGHLSHHRRGHGVHPVHMGLGSDHQHDALGQPRLLVWHLRLRPPVESVELEFDDGSTYTIHGIVRFGSSVHRFATKTTTTVKATILTVYFDATTHGVRRSSSGAR